MQSNSRFENAKKNIMTTTILTIVNIPLQFISRFLTLHYLGVKFLGISGLYSNILSVLSLADLGIGSAIVFSLYKPLSSKNIPMINDLMALYKKMYRAIATIILIFGVLISLLLPLLLKKDINYPNVILIFFIMLLGTVTTYLMASNQSLLLANQQTYTVSQVTLVINILVFIFQTISLIIYRSPIIYVTISVMNGLFTNLILTYVVHKKFNLNSGNIDNIPQTVTDDLKKNVFGNFVMRISGIVVNSTDSMLLSIFSNVYQVGLYSNYILLTSFLQRVLNQVINSISGGIGSYTVEKKPEESEKLYSNLQYLNFIAVNAISLGIVAFASPIITIWLGKEFIFGPIIVATIGLSFYVMYYRVVSWNFVSAFGLAKRMKMFSINEIFANLLFSLTMLNFMNTKVLALVLGTIFSTLSTVTWQDPYILYKYAFKQTPKYFFKKYIINLTIFLSGCVSVVFLNTIKQPFILKFVILIPTWVLFSVILPLLIYRKRDEFTFAFNVLKRWKK